MGISPEQDSLKDEPRKGLAPPTKGKLTRFIVDGNDELVEAINVDEGNAWQSKAPVSLFSKPSTCEADILEAAVAIDEVVKMDEKAASNALHFWQHSVLGRLCGQRLSPKYLSDATKYLCRAKWSFQTFPVGDRTFVFKMGCEEDKKKILN